MALKLQRKFSQISTLFLFFVVVYIVIFQFSEEIGSYQKQNKYNLSDIGIKKYPVATNYEKVDWNDYEFIAYEAKREGPGEQGKGFVLTDPKEVELNGKLYQIEGLNVVICDKISVNRSLQDTRPKE